MKKIVIILVMLSVGFSYAQKERSLKFNNENNLIEVVYYHDNGKISQTGSYTVEGKLQGDWLSYGEDGNKLISGNYNNGVKVGKWFYWSGNNLKEVDYSNNAIVKVNDWKNTKSAIASN